MGQTVGAYEQEAATLVEKFLQREQVPTCVVEEVRQLQEDGDSLRALELILDQCR